MPKLSPAKVLRRKISLTLVVVLSCGLTLSAQPNVRSASQQRTASYFESIRKSQPKQMAFLLKMPKGADLHNHLSGSIYAERYIEWAAQEGLCVNNSTMALVVPASPSVCDSAQTPANTALTNSVFTGKWSMHGLCATGR